MSEENIGACPHCSKFMPEDSHGIGCPERRWFYSIVDPGFSQHRFGRVWLHQMRLGRYAWLLGFSLTIEPDFYSVSLDLIRKSFILAWERK